MHYTPFSIASSGLPDTPIFRADIGRVKTIVWKNMGTLTYIAEEKNIDHIMVSLLVPLFKQCVIPHSEVINVHKRR